MTPMFSVSPACDEEEPPLVDELPQAAKVSVAAAARANAAHGRDRPAVRSTSVFIAVLLRPTSRLRARTRCIEYRRSPGLGQGEPHPRKPVRARLASPVASPGAGS